MLRASALLAALLVMSTGASAAIGAGRVRVSVSPHASVADQPMHLAIHGLAAGARVSVTMRSTDAEHVGWSSSAQFRASAKGAVDIDRAAPLRGSYRGVWGMGLVASLAPAKQFRGYAWDGTRPFTFAVTVSAGRRTLAKSAFTRKFSAQPLTTEDESLAATGFFGEYVAPANAVGRPAILVIGGSEGGLSTIPIAFALAAHGYPALAIAYWREPGLPESLASIPLEYFKGALRWLAGRPQVDPARILTLGISRGSEAALLLGVHYPDLVHGVIASVPSNVSYCAFPNCDGPAWTLDGKPIPYVTPYGPLPVDPAAVIPVEQIKGPIFLDCAGEDTIWPSCPQAQAILSRLDRSGFGYPHHLYESRAADHFVGVLVPYWPGLWAHDASFQEDERGREAIWPKLLAFLAKA